MSDKMADFYALANPDNVATGIKNYYYSQIAEGMDSYKNGTLFSEIDDTFESESARQKGKDLAALVITGQDLHNNKYTLIDEIKVIEDSYLIDEELSQSDKNALLRQSSVTRYSIALWDYMYSDPNSEFLAANIELEEEDPIIQGIFSDFISEVAAFVGFGVEVDVTPVVAGLTLLADGGTAVLTGILMPLPQLRLSRLY